jgi:hypothetical protein
MCLALPANHCLSLSLSLERERERESEKKELRRPSRCSLCSRLTLSSCPLGRSSLQNRCFCCGPTISSRPLPLVQLQLGQLPHNGSSPGLTISRWFLSDTLHIATSFFQSPPLLSASSNLTSTHLCLTSTSPLPHLYLTSASPLPHLAIPDHLPLPLAHSLNRTPLHRCATTCRSS